MEENQVQDVQEIVELPTNQDVQVNQKPTYEELENHLVTLSERLQEYDKAYREAIAVNQQLNITNIVKRVELLFKVIEQDSVFRGTHADFVEECMEEIVKLLSIEKKAPVEEPKK